MAQRVALDANLLLLLVVGAASRTQVGKHKRLKAYRTADYDLLREHLRQFERIVATPNGLTEVSNLAPQGIVAPLRDEIMRTLRDLVMSSDERCVESNMASADARFAQLGLTDAAWLSAVGGDTCLLTDDLELYLEATKRGLETYNFNHLREQRGTV